jgi:hypothetical protein
VFGAGCCPGFLGLLRHSFRFILFYFRSVVLLSLLLGCNHTANLFHQMLLLDICMGVRASQCGQLSVWVAHCHRWDSYPCPTQRGALTGQYHSDRGPYCLTRELSHSPTARHVYCEYYSIIRLHGAEVRPLRVCGRQARYIPTVLAYQ